MTTPVLLIGFNRPERLADLVASLRRTSPPTVRVAIDGPRPNHPTDAERVRACCDIVQRIDWTPDVDLLARQSNMGLERAIPDAVSWALESADRVIVVEDDVTVGDQFFEFVNSSLDVFAEREDVFHVSGYNVVRRELLAAPNAPARLTRVAESFAWATWKRAWLHYDAGMTWASACSLDELAGIVGSRTAAARWKQHFALARTGRISSWAYRWIASMWSQDGYCINPNRNLITYRGYENGTHTRRRARWSELPIERLSLDRIDQARFEPAADRYVHRQVFRATPAGVALGPVEAAALSAVNRWQRPRAAKPA